MKIAIVIYLVSMIGVLVFITLLLAYCKDFRRKSNKVNPYHWSRRAISLFKLLFDIFCPIWNTICFIYNFLTIEKQFSEIEESILEENNEKLG